MMAFAVLVVISLTSYRNMVHDAANDRRWAVKSQVQMLAFEGPELIGLPHLSTHTISGFELHYQGVGPNVSIAVESIYGEVHLHCPAGRDPDAPPASVSQPPANDNEEGGSKESRERGKKSLIRRGVAFAHILTCLNTLQYTAPRWSTAQFDAVVVKLICHDDPVGVQREWKHTVVVHILAPTLPLPSINHVVSSPSPSSSPSSSKDATASSKGQLDALTILLVGTEQTTGGNGFGPLVEKLHSFAPRVSVVSVMVTDTPHHRSQHCLEGSELRPGQKVCSFVLPHLAEDVVGVNHALNFAVSQVSTPYLAVLPENVVVDASLSSVCSRLLGFLQGTLFEMALGHVRPLSEDPNYDDDDLWVVEVNSNTNEYRKTAYTATDSSDWADPLYPNCFPCDGCGFDMPLFVMDVDAYHQRGLAWVEESDPLALVSFYAQAKGRVRTAVCADVRLIADRGASDSVFDSHLPVDTSSLPPLTSNNAPSSSHDRFSPCLSTEECLLRLNQQM